MVARQAVSKMVEIFKGAAKKPPQVILQELQALSGTIPGTLANAAGTMPGTLDPAAAETGKSAAITLSEEFAAAGTLHSRSNERNRAKHGNHTTQV